jgi:hypothetical protein
MVAIGTLGPSARRVSPWILGAAVLVASLGALLGLSPSVHATPWTGLEPTPTNLLFHLHNSSVGVAVGSVHYLDVLDTVNDSQAPWTHTGTISIAPHYDQARFVAAPQLAAPLQINGTIDALVYLNQSGSAPSGGSISLSVDQVRPDGSLTLLRNGPTTPTGSIGPGGSTPTAVFIAGPSISATIPAGDSLQLNLTINGNTAEEYGIWWGLVAGSEYVSTVTVPVSTYLTVPSVSVFNATGQPVVTLPTSVENRTVEIVATVDDPLGAYDFENFSVDFSLLSSNGTTEVAPTPMTPAPALAPPYAANGTYRISYNYSSLLAGTYNFTVNATDNTNHNLPNQDTLPSYYGRNAFGDAVVAVGLPPVPVSVTVVDDDNATLAGAVVQVRATGALLNVGRTNATGVATFGLAPTLTYSIGVSWEGVSVGLFTETVSGAARAFVLHAGVFSPTFQVVAAGGSPLPFPLVSVIHPNGSSYPMIVASPAGKFSLHQVPVGNYTVTVVYDDSEVVLARPVPVGSDGPIVVRAENVFTLIVRSTTGGNAALPSVFVSIENATSGSTVASGVTSGNGTLTFLVPAGSYWVIGEWATTYYLTPVQQTVSIQVAVTGPATASLTFTHAYPAFTSTNEFFLALGYGILAVLLGVMLILLVRRRRPTAPAETRTSATQQDAEVPKDAPASSPEPGGAPSETSPPPA